MSAQPLSLRGAVATALLTLTPAAAQELRILADPSPEDSPWRIPIHTPQRDPLAGEPGTWTSGLDFKASFHDGFVFFPLLGPECEEHLPFRWTTESISIGGAPVDDLDSTPSHRQSDWRYEYVRSGSIEAYDVRPREVEQSFVVRGIPAGAAADGDLVLVGRVDTPLTGDTRGFRHAPIRFRDANGRVVVRYGEAFAIDAAGNRTAARSAFDGNRIRLVVDGAWLEHAAFPVTVDPLVQSRLLGTANSSFSGRVASSDSASSPWIVLGPGTVVMVLSREFTATDHDAIGITTDENLQNVNRIWSDISAGTTSTRPRCAQAGPYWVITWQVGNSRTTWVRCYAHRTSSAVENSGRARSLVPPSGRWFLRPDVGGSGSPVDTAVTVVFEDQSAAGGGNDVWGVEFDASGATFGSRFRLAATPAGANRIRRWPAVIEMGDPWHLVAWSELWTSVTGDDWDVMVNVVDPLHGARTPWAAGPSADPQWSATEPQVDGVFKSFADPPASGALLAYRMTRSGTLTRTAIGYQMIEWSGPGTTPQFGALRTLATGRLVPPVLYGVAYDTNTDSHWTIVHQKGLDIRATRVGHSGGIVEQALVHSSPGGVGGASVCLVARTGDFAITFSDNAPLWPFYGRLFVYPSTRVASFGRRCGRARLSVPRGVHPYAGNGNFRLLHGSTTGTKFLLASTAPAANPIPVPNAPGCSLLLDPRWLLLLGGTTATETYVPLPDDPVFIGDLFFQVVYLDAAANPLGLITSDGLAVSVR